MNTEKYLLMGPKELGIILVSLVGAIIFHNLISGLLGVEEAAFFILAVFVIPAYFLVSLVYTIFHHVKKRKNKKK